MAVRVGSTFKTYEALTHAMRAYEEENFVNLIVRDTRSVEAASKRNHRKTYNPAIKYSDISFCCTYGGRKYVSHSTGKRNHKTTKQACPFSLKVRATQDGQELFVREMSDIHNHPISEAEFRFHPKQRKLDPGSQEEIATLLALEPDKRLLRRRLMEVTGKVILMKDIHNIKTRLLVKDGAVRRDVAGCSHDTEKQEETAVGEASCGQRQSLKNVSGESWVEKSLCPLQKKDVEAIDLLADASAIVNKDSENIAFALHKENGVKVVSQVQEKDSCLSSSKVIQVPLSISLPASVSEVTVGGSLQERSLHDNAPVLIHQDQLSQTFPSAEGSPQQCYFNASVPTGEQPQQEQMQQYHHHHQQQQVVPVLESPNMYAVNIHQAEAGSVYRIGTFPAHQQMAPLSSPAAAVSGVLTTSALPPATVTAVIMGGAGSALDDSASLVLPSTSSGGGGQALDGQVFRWAAFQEDVGSAPVCVQGSHYVGATSASPSPTLSSYQATLALPHNPPPHYHINTSRGDTNTIMHHDGNTPVSTSHLASSLCSSTVTLSKAPEQQQQHHCSYQPQQQEHHDDLQATPQNHGPVTGSDVLSPTVVSDTRNPAPSTNTGSKRVVARKDLKTARSRRKRNSVIQADKDSLLKKYFQQATVNLFFNERLKSPGSKFVKTLARMSGKSEALQYNDALKPLAWLFGKWRSEGGKGKYPTIQDFSYGEEAEFTPIGMQPNVEYKFYSWKPDSQAPMHRETGFIKIKPGTNHIAFVAAHNFGVVDLQEGEVTGNELSVTTQSLGSTSFNRDPKVKMNSRTFKRTGDQLEQVMYMQTEKTDLTEHLRITYSRL